MSYHFQIANATDQIRSLMKTSYLIPNGNPITLAGEELQPINFDKLPMGLIELEGAEKLTNNPAVKDLTITVIFYCWMIRQTDAGADDVSILRSFLRTLALQFQSDKRLNGTTSYLKLKGFNWSGTGIDFPTELQSGLQSGYVCLEVQISI